MKSKISLLCYLLLGCVTMNAQMNKIEFVEYDLDNGLHVILHQDNSTPIVAVTVSYHVGSKNEKPDRTGFAHFFEHLLFEGSENVGPGQFFKYVQNAGGTLNAYTTNDKTVYHEVLPSNQFEMGLWLESERMMHAKVNIKGVETQREVVKEERRLRYENQPYGTILPESMKRAFTKHPYRWPVIGSMDHLNAAQEADYKQFYEDFYVPNNAILSIAGDIDMAEAKAMISKYFAPIPKGTKPIYRPNIVEPEITSEVRDTVFDKIQLPAVIHTYRTPQIGHPDYYAVDMLSKLMAGGESSRLRKALVDEQQKALFVGNFPFDLEDPGVSLAFGITNMGVDPMDLEKAMDAEFAKAGTELMNDREFQKLKNRIESEFINKNASLIARAESLASYHMMQKDASLINTEIDKYLAVTREDIMRVAKKYFNKNNRVSLFFVPAPAKP